MAYYVPISYVRAISLNWIIFSSLVGTFILFNADCVKLSNITGIFITLH
ncbi:hypothetical protein [Orientia tsutsugamushi]|nr:hypothetical protein [Orientia tsutsugamushi]